MAFFGATIVKQYEKGVVFRLGKLRNVRAPGARFMLPSIRPEGTDGLTRQGNRGSGRKPDISVGCHSSPV